MRGQRRLARTTPQKGHVMFRFSSSRCPRYWRLLLAACLAGLMASFTAPAAQARASGNAALVTTAPAKIMTAASVGPGPDRVIIRRTEYGIPHILADSYRGLGYGEGYAFAQDNLCAMAAHVVTLRGERSLYFGPTGDSGDLEASPSTNLASDVYYRTVLNSATVERLLARPAPLGPTSRARQLVAGYAAGYDRYLRDTGVAHLPDPTCRGAAWVRPITALDIWRNFYDLSRVAGTGQFKQDIATATPPARTTKATAQTPGGTPLADTSIGSNAIALGRDATRNHTGMLLANPHFPWAGPDRFYQVQLTIPGVLNVAGASLYGTPVVEVGHTENLAFTGTVSAAQRFTLYQLALAPGDPTSYLVDGRRRQMSRQTVTIPVRGSDGRLRSVRRTVHGSSYGPVIASGWTTTTAFAVRDANAGNLRALDEWLAMDRSENLPQLRAAQDTYQGIPWSTTIAADSSGTAYFADASVVPHVTNAGAARCVSTPQGKAAYPGLIILNGATSACGWGSDPDAIEPGIFGPSHYPHLSRTDYVANSNNSAWLTNPAEPITGYPRIFGDTGTVRTLRTRLGLEMVSQRLRGTDGLGPAGFDLRTLQQVMLGDHNYSGELARGQAVAMCRRHPTLTASDGKVVNVAAACPLLARWNLRDDPDSFGAVLWREFWRRGVQASDVYTVPFDPAHPLTTPSTLNTGSHAVRRALADAVQEMRSLHLPLNLPLGTVQHVTAGTRTIPIEGCDNDEGCFNVASLPEEQLQRDGSYPDVIEGSSFIMAIDLTATGPRTRTILTYSESANPASPHHSDQTILYSRKQWVTDRFTEAQIAADPGLETLSLTM
jgi:acyl-homoserine-lactone acylase